MKKVLSLLLVLPMVLVLCSCGSSQVLQEGDENAVKVTIDYQNGLEKEVHYVEIGSLAPKPKKMKPTKEKCTFVNWCTRNDDKSLKKEWDFKTDTVTEDTVIHANYTLDDDFYLPEENADKLVGRANVRIMSFNVLASEWASCTNKYASERFGYFKNVLDRYLPDVVGVQEFNGEWYSEVEYGYPTYRLVNETQPTLDGSRYNYSTILYNTDKVEMLEFGQQMYENWDNAKTAKITWGYFKSKKTGKCFVVISTHWSLGDEMDLKQSVELWNKVQELQEKYQVPVICTGDFNSNDAGYVTTDGRESALVKFFEDSQYNDAKYAAKKKGLVCQTLHKGDGVSHTKGELGIKSFIDIKINQTNSVDHILFPPELTPTYYDTVVDEDALEASDHCPIYADFNIK